MMGLVSRRALFVGLAVVLAACSSPAHRAAAPATSSTSNTSTTAATSRTSCCSSTTATSAASTTTTSRTTTSGVAAPACVGLTAWSDAQLAAQLVVAPSYDFDVDELGSTLRQGVGGVLFIGSAAAPYDLASRVAAANRTAGEAGGLLTMADEEGGGVSRMAPLTSPVPWARTMAATMTTAQVEQLAARVGRQMRAAGVRLDLAPVVDLDDGAGPSSSNPDGQRSFSNSSAVTARYANAFATGLGQGGELATLKHFPGLGHSTGNTDVGPANTLPLEQLDQAALPAFASTFGHVAAVMVANASVPGLTAAPASTSPAAIGLLRNTMGWRGLVLTDSLSAGAIRAAGLTVPAGAARAVEAGADMVLFGSTLTAGDVAMLTPSAVAAETAAIVSALTAAVRDGQLPRAHLQDAARHVLAAKGVTVC
jgi:beta-N-acetylhexosaminidase